MKDKVKVGAAPRRWRTGWLNRRDDEIDDGSSSGTVMRDVEVLLWTTSSGKRLWLGGRQRRLWGFAGFRGLGVRMGGRMGWEWGTMA